MTKINQILPRFELLTTKENYACTVYPKNTIVFLLEVYYYSIVMMNELNQITVKSNRW